MLLNLSAFSENLKNPKNQIFSPFTLDLPFYGGIMLKKTLIFLCLSLLYLSGSIYAAPNAYLSKITTLSGPHINSPKSVIFSPDGSKFYINSLEGMETVVFDANSLKKLASISHRFTEKDAPLFQGEDRVYGYQYYSSPKSGSNNCFGGKPVEFAMSHNGKYLWVPYYRRSWDKRATSPSALAIIDTETNKPVRVMPTGTIPKMLAVSPDGNTLAVTNWGDNTIGLIDISSTDPANFRYIKQLVDGYKLPLANLSGDRDSVCGHCLRGTVFTPDSKHLLVGRMHGGGISVFDVDSGENIGLLTGFPPTPRHLAISADGKKLYVSSNQSGMISEVDLEAALARLTASHNREADARPKTLFVGKGARTLSLSPDNKYIYVACNNDSRLAMVDRDNWRVVDSIPLSPYGVGLAVNPSGDRVITTSQGRQGKGGHKVDVFKVSLPEQQ